VRESCRLDDAEPKLLSRSRVFLALAGIGAKAKPAIPELHVGAPDRNSTEPKTPFEQD
jgi:hypothetical protein